MSIKSGVTKSVWMDVRRPHFSKLDKSLECDVCIVGAGITGLTCAYKLAQQGKNIIVVDGGEIIGGETIRTTAHLSDVIDDTYCRMVHVHGRDNLAIIKESLTVAIDEIERIVKNENIICDFTRLDGILWLAKGTDRDFLTKELEAGLSVGFSEIEFVKALEMIKHGPPALRYSGQAQIHVVKYLKGLCKSLRAQGVKIYQDSRVEKIDTKNGIKARMENGKAISCSDIIVATNSPIVDFTIQTKQIAYRTFVVALRVEQDAIPQALYWDTEEPYHYVRFEKIEGSNREVLLIAGGEDHRTGEEDDADLRFRRLEDWVRDTFELEGGDIEYRWSGQVYEPTDGLGLIGRDPELGDHVYVATGDSGMGITNGTVAGMLLTDLIVGKENSWSEVYSPARLSVKAAPQYIKENVHSLAKYVDNISPLKTVKEEEIMRGQGGIVERGGVAGLGAKHLAAYRNKQGELSTVSSLCSHLGGQVCWNSCEKSWDCPVHGSRFTAEGKVIYGPADGDLKEES